MAEINPSPQEHGNFNRPGYEWLGIAQDDTFVAQRIEGGRYTCTVEGNFGAATTLEFQYSHSGDAETYHSIDSTNLTFAAQGSFNINVGRGYIIPVMSSSDGDTDLNAYLTPVPQDKA